MKSTFLQPDGQVVLVESWSGEIKVHILGEHFCKLFQVGKPVLLKDIGMTDGQYHRSIRVANAKLGNKLVIENSTSYL